MEIISVETISTSHYLSNAVIVNLQEVQRQLHVGLFPHGIIQFKIHNAVLDRQKHYIFRD